MVEYLIIGIVVAIVETIMTLVDLKKLGLTIYDLWPDLEYKRVFTICVLMFIPIVIAIVWPMQVFHWIWRIVSHKEVQEGGDSA